MSSGLSGIERAVFGPVPRAEVDGWLDRHLRARLGTGVDRVLWRSGRISAVCGLLLADGRQVAAKVHRSPAEIGYLAACVEAQRTLRAAGHPCPEPLDGPAATDGRVATLEKLLVDGEPANAHRPSIRMAMARSLAEQVEILRPTVAPAQAQALAADPPAWAAYAGGPWPVPHDPIFDFRVTPPGYAWMDDLAAQAADVLRTPAGPRVVGHSDRVCQNLRFRAGEVVAAYDWDSLMCDAEPVVAGVSAAAFPEGSTLDEREGACAPDEAAAFLADYDACRATRFTAAEQAAAAAAVTWTLAARPPTCSPPPARHTSPCAGENGRA